ncbi:MAG: ribonuclease R, partial [Phycisphaerae bacterium]|nr:ribonuclease R [Phycisphaerae bacterium]NIX28926.1 ribonuclease R [Phycisphaerae bacterium]
DWVAVKIAAHSGRLKTCQGEIIEVLGDPADPRVEMKASACRHNIPLHFTDAVKQAAKKVPADIVDEDTKDRTDLRHLPFVT